MIMYLIQMLIFTKAHHLIKVWIVPRGWTINFIKVNEIKYRHESFLYSEIPLGDEPY